MSRESVKIIEGCYASFAKGDVMTVLAAMDPQIVWSEAETFSYADGSPYIGPQAVLSGVFARVGGDWDGFTIVPDELLDAGDTVVMRGRYQGVFRATGVRVNAQAVHVFKLRDGKITQFQQYADTAQLRDAMAQRASA